MPKEEIIRVVVVDDHDLFRVGLVSMLSAHPDIAVVGQASRGEMGVRLVEELSPHVVLMDQRMPDVDGPEATRAILARRPMTRVLALTVLSGDGDVAAAMQAGAVGFLAKDGPIDDVAVAVRAAARGVSWLSPRAAELVLGRVRRSEVEPGSNHGPLEPLSPRELEVLRLLARGMENTAIATTLEISPRTAKNHVSSILRKLGVPGRIQAAVYAVRHGLD